MYQIIQYDLRCKNRNYLVKQVMSIRIAQYFINCWNQCAESSNAPVQYCADFIG